MMMLTKKRYQTTLKFKRNEHAKSFTWFDQIDLHPRGLSVFSSKRKNKKLYTRFQQKHLSQVLNFSQFSKTEKWFFVNFVAVV